MAETSPRADVAVVGMSLSATCGVHDHARVLAGALEREQLVCSFHWLHREQLSLDGSVAEIGAFGRALAAELAARPPRAILLHYSVFSYSYRGLPLFTRPLLSALRRAGVPIAVVLHEAAYPFGHGGLRGFAWASTQRVALLALMRGVSGAIVTADFRAAWLTSRRWLPKRPVRVAPVFSNLPAPGTRASADGGVVGLFGYAYEGSASALVLDAIARLRDDGVSLRLLMLGAPGASSPAGQEWAAAATAHGLDGALSFSGKLPAQELADALAGCELLVFADLSGPSSRKTTLASSLASGAPVVAIDGPHAWAALLADGAACVVAPSPSALATALRELLADTGMRRELGARGRAFAESEMSPGRTAGAVRELLDGALRGR